MPRWFWAAAALLLCLDVWVLGRDALFRAAVSRRMAVAHSSGLPFDIEELSRRDPVLGSALPFAGAGRRIRAEESGNRGGYLLVALSSCTACTRLDFGRWMRDTRASGVRLLAVSSSPPADIAAFRTGARKGLLVYHDPDGALHDRLNAWWNGRLYYFDQHWRLRWASSFGEADRSFSSLPGLRAAISRASGR